MSFDASIIMQYKYIFIVILAFLLGALFSYILFLSKRKKDSFDKKKIESYVKGINYIIEDETDKAIEEFTETAKIDPDLIDIYISIGNLFRKKGEINRALIIHKSLLVRPNLTKKKKLDIYINVGVDYRKAGLYDRAKEYFKNALSIDPKNMLAKRLLYEVYEDSRDWENALIWHKRFGKANENILAHIYTELGKEKLRENSVDIAKKNFEKALKIDKTCVDAMIHLGDVYFYYGDLEKAYKNWEEACKIKPEMANIALKRINDTDKLTSTIVRLLNLMPENIYILYFCANELFEIGEKDKAISLYNKLMKMNIKTYSMLRKFVEAKREVLPKFITTFTDDESKYDVRYTCTNCGYNAHKLFFRCPKCRQWDSVKVEII
jgi:lipopolysaccharide biosynthesis regulator YciM